VREPSPSPVVPSSPVRVVMRLSRLPMGPSSSTMWFMDARAPIVDNARHRPKLRTDLPMAIIDVKSVRVLLFDLGGVLIDVDPLRSYEHWARAAGVDPAFLRGRSI